VSPKKNCDKTGSRRWSSRGNSGRGVTAAEEQNKDQAAYSYVCVCLNFVCKKEDALFNSKTAKRR